MRRELPWVRIDKPYAFDANEGRKTLAELFDSRSRLRVYHFMFGPDWDAGCVGCSMVADHFDGGMVHLNQRDVTMVCVSRAPLEKLNAYKRRTGVALRVGLLARRRLQLRLRRLIHVGATHGPVQLSLQTILATRVTG